MGWSLGCWGFWEMNGISVVVKKKKIPEGSHPGLVFRASRNPRKTFLLFMGPSVFGVLLCQCEQLWQCHFQYLGMQDEGKYDGGFAMLDSECKPVGLIYQVKVAIEKSE